MERMALSGPPVSGVVTGQGRESGWSTGSLAEDNQGVGVLPVSRSIPELAAIHVGGQDLREVALVVLLLKETGTQS